ncbi:MAG: sensor histidine kinase, partial [Dinghuibacter sp.]|nr:sensor histidine kinase [Dinghuibacter sp.]
QQLTQRNWIENDKAVYDYLNHYYLAKSKIEVFYYKRFHTPYIDSLEMVFSQRHNLDDSVYYSNELLELYNAIGNRKKENYYLGLNHATHAKFNNPESVRETQEKLDKMEVAAVEAQRKAENEKANARMWFIIVLSGLLVTISLLAFFLHRRNREIGRKQKEVVHMNEQLYQKNLQNELLNREIHHRVKNNLQMIMSLVYMQETNTHTEEVKENMQNIRLRIESIASLHQQLMEQAEAVNLKKYIQYLVSNATGLIADNRKVITHLEVEPLQVPQKISFPLGLIINEWVTNSVKYAQPANGILEIAVGIFNGGNKITVNYKDNGLPPAQKTEKKSLGLEIVNILVEQLGGHFEPAGNNLYNYKLTIPVTHGE